MKNKTTFIGGSVLALTLALAGNACAQALTMTTVTTPETMTCHEFTQMNPKAMTPVMVWVVNKDLDYKNGDYVDWQKVQTIMVPQVIKVCKKSQVRKLSNSAISSRSWFQNNVPE
ncbi:HdeA/HdeB family chaperone [Edwardsiella anguillarum]|nr:HdeA/HdeB family chaperone [Edwardsiella anguillarum]